MPHGHGVDNFRLTSCRQGRQLDLGESRSLTQIFQRNQLPASHRFWAYVCVRVRSGADGDDGDGDGDDDSDGDGVGDGNYSTRST